jgi:hypothetical protein
MVEVGGLRGDYVSAIQKGTWLQLTTLECKRHSQLSLTVKGCCTSNDADQWPEGTVGVRVRSELENTVLGKIGFIT